MTVLQDVFTTGQAARLLKVPPATVRRWCDARLLKHYMIPGTQDRRIPRRNLWDFMRQHDLPTADLGFRTVLIVCHGATPEGMGGAVDSTPDTAEACEYLEWHAARGHAVGVVLCPGPGIDVERIRSCGFAAKVVEVDETNIEEGMRCLLTS